jgi:hypothetical protein
MRPTESLSAGRLSRIIQKATREQLVSLKHPRRPLSTAIPRLTLLIRSGKTALCEGHISITIRVNLVSFVRSGGSLR